MPPEKSASHLAATQRWMQRFIVDPASDARLIRRERASARVRVKPSRALKSEERVAIYRGMYLLRMNEALLSDFPALESAVGHEGFHRLVADYVAVYPSRSYTFNDLRQHIVRFLATWGPKRQRAWLADIAAVECALADAFDAPRSGVLTARQAAAVPASAWPAARLEATPSLHLLSLRYPVNDVLPKLRDGAHLHAPRPQATWLAVFRRDDRVWRLPLSEPAFVLVTDLSRGVPLGRALRRAAAADPDLEPAVLHSWFQRWVAEGIFAAVKRPPARRRAGTRRR